MKANTRIQTLILSLLFLGLCGLLVWGSATQERPVSGHYVCDALECGITIDLSNWGASQSRPEELEVTLLVVRNRAKYARTVTVVGHATKSLEGLDLREPVEFSVPSETNFPSRVKVVVGKRLVWL